MTASTHTSASRGLPPRLLIALVTLLTTVAWAGADEVPSLRQGLWQYQRTLGTSRFTATECIDPSQDLKRQHAAMEKVGCKLAPAQRNGTTYTYDMKCAVKLPSGVVTFSTTSVLTADSDTAYRIENRSTKQGVTSNESITAQRVADCVE